MKSNLLFIFGAVATFASSGLVTYKLLNRRRFNLRSFREIYYDNTGDFEGGSLFEDKSEDGTYVRREYFYSNCNF